MILEKPKISLIIPVYNSENFLQDALYSVENQTFKDVEVIIVNDGSTDGSAEIIDKFLKRNKNFRVINQENKGLGFTKNVAIRQAKGEFVAFLDSDDFLAPDFLSELYNLATKNNADIAYCNFNIYRDKSGIKLYMPFTSRSRVYLKYEALGKLIMDITMHHFTWNKLYRRSLFVDNNIEFLNMYYEDIATSPKLFYKADKIAVTSKALYYYRRHKNSIISSMDEEKINDFIKSFALMRNFLEENNLYKNYRKNLKMYALRLKIQVFYCILREHIAQSSLKGLWTNLKKSNISINTFADDRYKATAYPIILPFYVTIPQKNCILKKDLPKI